MNLLQEEFVQKLMIPAGSETLPNEASREEKIASFNKRALEVKLMKGIDNSTSTHNFKKKINDGISVPLSSLSPIRIVDLEVEKTHRGCVVFGRIVTDVMKMASIMVLIEDESTIVGLAVYGDKYATKEFKVGRMIAIKEPYFKMRHDGTKGIRVDNPRDIEFDPPDLKYDQPPMKERGTFQKRGTVEERLQEILLEEDGAKGVDKLYRQLNDEGYIISKKKIKALKKTILVKASVTRDTSASVTRDTSTFSSPTPAETGKVADDNSIVPIISERRPETHQVLRVKKVLDCKEAGNKALLSGRYQEAEQLYSEALKNKKGPHDDSVCEVYLWQLYSNRSAARLKLGELSKAFEDSLASNMCAPCDVVKPLLRCVETMTALGLHKEALTLLSDCEVHFPQDVDVIKKKRISIAPSKVLVVGKDEEISSISTAIRIAPVGAEIIVRPGVYREYLYINKPVTLRCTEVVDYDAIRSLEDSDSSAWAEVQAIGHNGIVVHCKKNAAISHIVGFKISCVATPVESFHPVNVMGGNVVIRNCSITSSSGPVLCAQFQSSNVFVQGCAIYNGAQGGILGVDGARLSLHQTRCCHNAAIGLELRTGASASLESCYMYDNGRQGIMLWKNAGTLTAKNCEIHSHPNESGVFVGEAEAAFDGCKIYGNNFCGAASQQKGVLKMFECEVHDNNEGILIQDSGSAYIEKCKVYSNRANGIFVGFDHQGSAVLAQNEVNNNHSKGILIGSNKKVVIRGNHEDGNRGLPPQMPTNLHPKNFNISKKYLKRTAKNKVYIKKAIEESTPVSFLDTLVKEQYYSIHENVTEDFRKRYEMCAFCGASPPDNKPFLKCSRCRETSYCSKKCHKVHWPEHKKTCQNKNVKYPSFLDNDLSV